MNKCFLKDIAQIDISSVDKKVKENEISIKLCNFTDVYNNWAITERMYNNFMNATANRSEIERYKLKKGMIAITKDSEKKEDIGMSSYIADSFDDVILGYHTALINPYIKNVDSKYLNAYLNSYIARKYFSKSASGSGQRYTLTIDIIKKLPLYLPSLDIQKKIGNLLSNIDRKIEINYQINNNLEELMKTIYQRWFIEFEFPNEEGKSYKSNGGKLYYNRELKHSLPEGWKVSKIKDCIKHINTGLNPRDNFVLGKGKIKYITVKNINENGTLDFSNCDLIDENAWKIIHNRSDIRKDDILFASIAPLGRCYLIMENPKDWEINESVFSIRPNNKVISSAYLYRYLMSEYFVKKAERSSTGSVFNGIRINVLENMNIVIPNDQILDNFSQIIKNIMIKKYYYEKENVYLNMIKTELLPLLINGQINVDDIEI